MRPILIAADHAGYPLKEELKKHAKELGVNFLDLGTHSIESVDYPDFAGKLCQKLIEANDDHTLGVLVCGSGVGISIAANRYPQIRAVLAESELTAQMGREHNHANVLCMGARQVSPEKALLILKAYLNAKPDLGERHVRRVQKLSHPPKKEFP